jgi:three-Cys-motif partner protein
MPKNWIIANDGLCAPIIKTHSEQKHKLIAQYAGIFANSMKYKWDCRVYVDLFASAGKAMVEDENRVVDTSALLAVNVQNPFDKYIFCELENELLDALKQRVVKANSNISAEYIYGDCNKNIDAILSVIPHASTKFRVLSFCVVDPFAMGGLNFETLRRLSVRYMDFLVLIPTYMDANRNLKKYDVNPANVASFIGKKKWLDDWHTKEKGGIRFSKYIADSFTEQMVSLNPPYLRPPVGLDELVRIKGNQSPLYQLSFYSRHPLGQTFWKQAQKYSKSQQEFELQF